MNSIEVDGLVKKYGELKAVNNISFTVREGSLFGFLGVNGAGKSTTIHMLSTLMSPDEGSAAICGHRLGKENRQIRESIGIVYQGNCLDGLLTVKENLICRGVVHGASTAEAEKQCKRLAGQLQLEELLKKKYRNLSGGQKRKCEIAAALMHTPKLLFLDEPTTGLDPATRIDVWNFIEQLRRQDGVTVFLTTHYMEEASVADEIVMIDRGEIIAEGSPFVLKEQFAKDKVILYFADGSSREETVEKTLDALALVERIRNRKEEAGGKMLTGFEVIQGTMDDVFLNAVAGCRKGEV